MILIVYENFISIYQVVVLSTEYSSINLRADLFYDPKIIFETLVR